MTEGFRRFASWLSEAMGAPLAFILALTVCLVWAASGPIFNFSATWQLVINTGTTVITFLMIFLVQNSQNEDTKAMHKKLDKIMGDSEDVGEELVGLRTPTE